MVQLPWVRTLYPGITSACFCVWMSWGNVSEDAGTGALARAGAAEDSRSFLLGRPVQARPIHLWGRAVKWLRRQPLAAGGGLGTCRVAVLMALWYFLYGLR
jgi:hypothetical protein